MSQKIYPKGIVARPRFPNQPEFVLGSVLINPDELFAWISENSEHLTEYKDGKQLKLQLLNGSKGMYLVLDNYRKPE